jgi:hypothetical protein
MKFRLYDRNLSWHDDEEFREVMSDFAVRDPFIRDRKFILYSFAQALVHLRGDTAECGVYEGRTSHLMCRAAHGRDPREHHIFDSFDGLSEPTDHDATTDPTAYQWKKHDLGVPEETVRENLKEFEFVKYYAGWIPDRFGEVADRRFSLVHIDVDLYQPTKDAVEFFYPRLVRGGVIVCDDYGFTTCPGARLACDEYAAELPQRRVIHLSTGQGLLVRTENT